MATPDKILNAVERALKQAGNVTSELDYLTHEWGEGVERDGPLPTTPGAKREARIQAPFCVIQVPGSGVQRKDEPVVEIPIRDNNDGHIGTFYYIPFEIDVQIDVNTATGSDDNAGSIGKTIMEAMFRYDSSVRGEPLPGETTPLDTVTDVRVGGGDSRLRESTSPETMRWIRTIEADYFYGIDSTEVYGPENYVKEVVWAHAGDMVGDGETVSYDPRQHFP